MHRCPKCGSRDVVGGRKSFSKPNGQKRVIEEFFCPTCSFREAADSDSDSYSEVQARWNISFEEPIEG
jgi:DNA-directed RNA polymerase subunit RPC12/RpoP